MASPIPAPPEAVDEPLQQQQQQDTAEEEEAFTYPDEEKDNSEDSGHALGDNEVQEEDIARAPQDGHVESEPAGDDATAAASADGEAAQVADSASAAAPSDAGSWMSCRCWVCLILDPSTMLCNQAHKLQLQLK